MNFNSEQVPDETNIELTPLIDVVFLLLIFFMISTTFTKETALKINLPESSSGATDTQPLSIEVQIGPQSQYAIQTSDQAEASALVNNNRDTLRRALAEFQSREGVVLVIRADRLAPHEAVIKVLDVAQELSMTNITFTGIQSMYK